MKQVKKLKKILFIAVVSILCLSLVFIIFVYSSLYFEVKKVCLVAQAVYKMDCIDSLVNVLDADDTTFKQKNDAIWVLGQMADKRSLPVLKNLYTGKIPEREPLDKTVSQYELKKAIRWIEEGNWTSWMYGEFK